VVGNRVALAGRPVTVEGHSALAVEMRRDLVAIEIVEHRCQCFSSLEDVGRLGAFAVHVNGEDRVSGEERLLPFGVAAIGAVGVSVEELAQC
jgi:hypothetical protein